MSLMQEKEEPEYAFELKKQEDEYDKKRAKLQILFGKHRPDLVTLQRKQFLWKWVGGSRSHSDFFFFKSSQNSPKPVLIFWNSIQCVFC